MLETKRLILRPWREEDAQDLYEYAKDPDIGYPAGWPAHTGVENSRQIIRDVLSAPETYAICLKDGRAIGSVGLKLKGSTHMTDREDECELGYWLGKPFWGQGLMPEACHALLRHAFEKLHMRAVWCGYYEGNEKSRRVQEKLGFVYCYTTCDLDVPLVNEKRTGHTSLLTKERWEMLGSMTITAKSVRNAPNKAQIKKLYLTAFPKEERLPWWLLRLSACLKRGELTAYYDGDTFCGFAYTAAAGEVFYVMFFAVSGDVRRRGYGSGILQYLKQTNPGKYILLNVEIPDEAAPNNDQRLKRMAFYRKNGFSDTGYNIREVGGVFRILSSTGKMDEAAYQRVFSKISCGLWRPKITRVKE